MSCSKPASFEPPQPHAPLPAPVTQEAATCQAMAPATAYLRSAGRGRATLSVFNVSLGHSTAGTEGPVVLVTVATSPELASTWYTATEPFIQWSAG